MPVLPSVLLCAMPMVRSTFGWCRRIVSSNSCKSSSSAPDAVAARRLLIAHRVELYTATRTSPKLPAPIGPSTFRSLQLTRLESIVAAEVGEKLTLASSGLADLAFSGLASLAFDGLADLAFDGLASLAFDGPASLTIDGLASLVFDGLASLTIDGLASLTCDGLASSTPVMSSWTRHPPNIPRYLV